MKKRALVGIGLIVALAVLPAFGAKPGSTELYADKVTYDSDVALVDASGNVVMKKDTSTIYCDNFKYQTKTEDFWAEGNVHGTDVDRKFRCEKAEGNGKNKTITATGNVYIQDKETIIEGGQVYGDDIKGYSKATINPKVTNKNSVVTGDVLECFNRGEKLEGTGHVVITSDQGNGSGDHCVYYQKTGDAVLTGNAMVHNQDKTLTGPKILMHTLDNGKDHHVETEGRSRLLIEPAKATN